MPSYSLFIPIIQMIETLLFIAWISLLGAMSPWPDFVVVMKNSITRWRLHGFVTALWVSSAIMVHSFVVIVWLGAVLASSVIVFQAVKIAWACYLLYLAYQLWTGWWDTEQDIETTKKEWWDYTYLSSYWMWCITNISNPKFIVFLLSLFAQLFSPDTWVLMYVLSGIVIASTAILWFGSLSYVLGNWVIKRFVYRYQKVINKIFGWLLAWLWLKILSE